MNQAIATGGRVRVEFSLRPDKQPIHAQVLSKLQALASSNGKSINEVSAEIVTVFIDAAIALDCLDMARLQQRVAQSVMQGMDGNGQSFSIPPVPRSLGAEIGGNDDGFEPIGGI